MCLQLLWHVCFSGGEGVALRGSATRELEEVLVCARRLEGCCCYNCCGQQEKGAYSWGLLWELRLFVGFLLLLCVHCACIVPVWRGLEVVCPACPALT